MAAHLTLQSALALTSHDQKTQPAISGGPRVRLSTPSKDTDHDPTKEYTIKHILATEMRIAPGDTRPTRHALIHWCYEDFTDALTWEPMPGAVAKWKPYWSLRWQYQEYKLVRVWAGRKTARGVEYLVEWDEFPFVDYLTWEPEETITSTFPEGLQEYKKTGGMVAV
ncbi:uncharacterized protein L3040_008805 [Drepanopeziza brunnea f. sp. 'multigermtubi']|uniref:uncharacterized protein n=1 Tax=Drepanopeziza brunnea f. sp. 'multigermtubi' TaxID=698441 RepID=UPI0023A606F8|nr:hypothetical protein L3040_008805 [Drepanopeziza brunnea f. sp. 'multigermtubi']